MQDLERLPDSTEDPELEDLREVTVDEQTKGLGAEEELSELGFPDDVSGYIAQLSRQQRQLLKAALVHARDGAHGGRVRFRRRHTGYRLKDQGIGLEVMDATTARGDRAGEDAVEPLIVVFIVERTTS